MTAFVNYLIKSMSRLIIFACLVLFPGLLRAQSYTSPSQTGSGGVSLFLEATPEAAFVNPSFMMLTDDNESVVLSILSGGLFKSTGYTSNGFSDPKSILIPFKNPVNISDYVFENNSDDLLNAWFGPSSSNTLITHNMDVITLGIMFKSTDMAFSINHRLRGTSISEISRGWYDSTFNSQDGEYTLNRSLSQYSSYRHEIGVGFAWEQGLLSGLIGNRSAIYVGVNPKLILPVEYINGQYRSTSTLSNLEDTEADRTHSIDLIASENSCLGVTLNPFVCSTNNPSWTKISGFGAGFDAGITWRFSLGEGIRLREDLRPVSDYQISLSVAVNDIGFISQRNSKALEIESNGYSSDRSAISSVNREYNSTPESFFRFIGDDLQFVSESSSNFTKTTTYLTPTTLSAGIGLELNRIKLGMEYQQQTGNQNTSADFSSLHFGNEINLIPFLSIKSGFIVQPDESVIYTAGLGFDTSWLSISASTMARQLETNDEIRPVMMNLGTLNLRF
jgi:hypothetical protein